MLNNFKRTLMLLALLPTAGPLYAQASPDRAAAKAEFAQGQAALKKSEFAQAAVVFRKAVELDPDYAEAHAQFIGASRRARKEEERAAVRQELQQLYQSWAEKYPGKAIFQLMLGDLCESEKSKAEPYYLKAVALDAKLARGFMELSLIAEIRGENEQRRAYLKKAAEAAPEDPSYLFYYSQAMRESDPARYRVLTQELLKRFPQHERSAQSLYWLALETTDVQEKRAILEQLRRDFPPGKFSWSHSGMELLFDVYVEQEPARALALAEALAKLDPKDKSWAAKATLQQNVLNARALLNERKFAEAAALLESTTAPRYTNVTALHLTRAEAYDRGGETAKAFDSLAKVAAQEPADALLKALNAYGAKLGKTAAQIEGELWRLRDEQAKPFKEFALAKSTGTGTASLGDYRGKVVLVDFWYPTCGPCRGEFPNLQKALDKYGPRGFVILAINVEPPEDDMVLPYLKHNRYGFIPLKSNWDWARENYGVRGAPTNFLIDHEGRVVFKPGVIRSAEARRTFELQVEALLARRPVTQ